MINKPISSPLDFERVLKCMKQKSLIFAIIFVIWSFDGFAQTLQNQLNSNLKILESKANDLNALYRVSEAYIFLGGKEENDIAKKKYFEKASSYAEKCRQVNAESWQANYALALAYGAMQQISDDKNFRKTCAKTVKEWIDKALKVNPKHADSWSVLGVWHYRMANLGKLESIFIGDLKNGASNAEAKKCLQRAIQLEPNDLKFYPIIAKIYQVTNQNTEAEMYLKKAVSMAGNNPEYKFLVKKCNEMLNELK